MIKISNLFNLVLFTIIATFILNTTSCKKDEAPIVEKVEDSAKVKVIKNLVGSWDVKSFTDDGVESISTEYIIDFTMNFEAYNNNKGDFKWTVIYSDGLGGSDTDIIKGEYRVNEKGDEITIMTDTSEDRLNMTIDEGDFTFEGNMDGSYIIIRAKK